MKTRAWFRVHSFTGVITGLLLFVICWSGTFAVVSNEIDWLVTPEARVDPGNHPMSWGAITAAVEASYHNATITWLSEPLYTRSAAQLLVDLPQQDSVWIYVDPYRAEVLGDFSYFNVQRFFRSFHMNLFFPGVGKYVVSLFALTMLVSLVAALFFYKRWWQRFLRRPRGRGRALWSELHKVVGLWSIWFLLVIGVTGLWYLVEAVRYDFVDGKISYAGSADFAVYQFPEPMIDPAKPLLPINELLDTARELRPDLEIRRVFVDETIVTAVGQAEHLLVRDRANCIHLDRRTGAVIYNQTPEDYPLYWRWTDTADPLHFGDFAGLTSKLIWFVFGLLLCGLIFTGTYLHAQRLARGVGGSVRHRWPGTVAAVVVSLMVLAASVPFGLWEAREYYGPTVNGVKQLPELALGVKVVIIGWVTLTLLIIAAWVWLLWSPKAAPKAPEQRNRASLSRVKGEAPQ